MSAQNLQVTLFPIYRDLFLDQNTPQNVLKAPKTSMKSCHLIKKAAKSSAKSSSLISSPSTIIP